MVYSLTIDVKLSLFETMYRIRKVEEEIALRYSGGKMRCPTHLSIGQELVPSIFAQFVQKSDFAVSTHRGHAHYLAKGGDLKGMIAEIYGKKTGCAQGKGGSMHLIDTSVNFMGTSAIVGNSIPVGVGLGLSAQLKETKQISFIFLGDGATEEGVFYESVNFAVVRNLPVVFVCENNFFSVYSSLEPRQPKKRKISKMVGALGIKSYSYDGKNIEECFNGFRDAYEFTKKNRSPVFLEFSTFRWREHCGPNFDDELLYRDENEVKKWIDNCPIKKIEKQLSDQKNQLTNLKTKIDNEIDLCFKEAENAPFPEQTDAYKDVYA